MQRVLNFYFPEDKGKYRMLLDSLILGGNAERSKKGQEGLSRDARRAEVRVKRALHSIGEPDGEAPPDATGYQADTRQRTLKTDGGQVILDQPDLSMLLRYVSQTPWLTNLVEQQTELEDFLEAAPEHKPEKKDV